MVSRLIETAETISEYPQLGRMVPELGEPNIRERLVHRYRLIYRLEQDRVVVTAVIHGRQDFQTKWHHDDDKPEI